MTTVFPAQPGTFMIERDAASNPPTVIRIPVIAWQHLQGNLAYPICVLNHNGLTHGKAILHPEGYVTDAIHRAVFASEAEWLNFMKTAKSTDKVLNAPEPYTKRSDRAEPYTEADYETEPERDLTKLMPDPDAPKAKPGPVPKPKPKVAGIPFGTKTFKTTSYWTCEAGVFIVEGGNPYPKSGAEKITRDEFTSLKKNGATVIDPHGETDEAEDDDGMELI